MSGQQVFASVRDGRYAQGSRPPAPALGLDDRAPRRDRPPKFGARRQPIQPHGSTRPVRRPAAGTHLALQPRRYLGNKVRTDDPQASARELQSQRTQLADTRRVGRGIARQTIWIKSSAIRLCPRFDGCMQISPSIPIRTGRLIFTSIGWSALCIASSNPTKASARSTQPNPGLITGTQEDIDLVVATGDTLLLIEAKGEGAWSNTQLASKIGRLKAIDAGAHRCQRLGQQHPGRFSTVLTSRHASKIKFQQPGGRRGRRSTVVRFTSSSNDPPRAFTPRFSLAAAVGRSPTKMASNG